METQKLTYIDWWKKGADIEPPKPGETPAAPTTPNPYMGQGGQGEPFIQPLVIVPYVSNDQPLYYYDAAKLNEKEDVGGEEYYEDMFETEESSALEPAQKRYAYAENGYDGAAAERPSASAETGKKRRRANVFAILSFILCAVYIALLFNLTKLMASFTYNFLYDDMAAFDIIKNFVQGIVSGGFTFDVNTTLVPMLVTAGVLLMAITAICSICTVASRTPIIIKIFAILALLLNAGAAVVAKFIVKMEITTFGLYILAGIALVVCVFTLVARNKKNK